MNVDDRQPANDNQVMLRDVREEDLPIFFEQQANPLAVGMAGIPSRDRATFDAHWAKIRLDPNNIMQTIVFDGNVAGNVVSFVREGEREVGYMLGQAFWGKGIATAALKLFLQHVSLRPLHAFVIKPNIGSQRVLQKCGFVQVAEEDEGFLFKLEEDR